MSKRLSYLIAIFVSGYGHHIFYCFYSDALRSYHSWQGKRCTPGTAPASITKQETPIMKELKTSLGLVINGMGLWVLLSHLGQWHAG